MDIINLELVKTVTKKTVRKLEQMFDVLNLIEVSRSTILDNYYFFQKLHPDKQIWPVLKANAYGHGIKQVAKILQDKKCHYLVVDSYYEALQIWEVNPKQKVLLVGATLPGNFQHMKLSRLAIAVYDKDSIKTLGSLNKKVKIHLKINTGFNRLGIKPDQLDDFLKLIKKHENLELEGVSSHLADADGENDRFTISQKKKFTQVLSLLESKGVKLKFIHLAATAGSLKINDLNTNAIRLGIGLYGYNPVHSKNNDSQKLAELKPALRFTSRLINIIELKKGDKVGYGLSFTAPKDMTIGVVPVGYYDLFDRKLSNKGFIKFKNNFLPIVGRVSMNITMVDLLNTSAELWDEVEVVSAVHSDKNSITTMADITDTIPYESLVRINGSTRRIIV